MPNTAESREYLAHLQWYGHVKTGISEAMELVVSYAADNKQKAVHGGLKRQISTPKTRRKADLSINLTETRIPSSTIKLAHTPLPADVHISHLDDGIEVRTEDLASTLRIVSRYSKLNWDPFGGQSRPLPLEGQMDAARVIDGGLQLSSQHGEEYLLSILPTINALADTAIRMDRWATLMGEGAPQELVEVYSSERIVLLSQLGSVACTALSILAQEKIPILCGLKSQILDEAGGSALEAVMDVASDSTNLTPYRTRLLVEKI